MNKRTFYLSEDPPLPIKLLNKKVFPISEQDIARFTRKWCYDTSKSSRYRGIQFAAFTQRTITFLMEPQIKKKKKKAFRRAKHRICAISNTGAMTSAATSTHQPRTAGRHAI